jgi:ATP-binding cassette subfamily C (CFTR/MRP) protein 4
MHLAMCERVLRANVLFFDSNPIGRILTRFSKDMAVLDYVAPPTIILMTYGIFRAFTVAISLVIINYWLLIPAAFAVGYLIYLMRNATIAMIEA